MKRLLAAFAVAAVLPAAPAVASYSECMRLCMSQQPFQACHGTCKELVPAAPAAGTNAREAPATPDAGTGSPAAAPKAAESLPPIPDVLKGRDCRTTGRKADAAYHYIYETFDPLDAGVLGAGDGFETAGQAAFRVFFFQRDKQRGCTAWMEITDECRVSFIARSDLRPSFLPLLAKTGSYFVKVEHGELKCEFATE